MKSWLSFFLLLLLLVASGCASQPRQIVAEPLGKHDREQDIERCLARATKFGSIDMEPVMAGNAQTRFPDGDYQIQLYESCMLGKGYRF